MSPKWHQKKLAAVLFSALAPLLSTSLAAVAGAGLPPKQVDQAEVERVRASVSGNVLIVDWHGIWDYTTIQAALDVAGDGDTVIVLPSTGSPDGAYVENIIFPARAITLKSLEPETPAIVAATVIDGGAVDTVLRFAAGTPSSAALQGFTITHGTTGIHCENADPSISHNVIRDNVAVGIHLQSSSPSITHNTIHGNNHDPSYYTTGGGLWLESSSPTIMNNTITDNIAVGEGAGLYMIDSFPTIANNLIARNNASFSGGALCLRTSSPMISNNVMVGNVARASEPIMAGAALVALRSSPVMMNNLIAGNVSYGFAGALYFYDSTTVITNNTIVANGHQALLAWESSVTMTNTIVAFNDEGLRGDSTLTATLRHNCVYGNDAYDYHGVGDPTGTNGNISVDPELLRTPDPGPDGFWGTADDDYGDLHLLPTSPCVDAGDNADVVEPFDLDGHTRVVDGDWDGAAVVDMGAYEYQPADLDGDGAVSLADYALWADCLGGPNTPCGLDCLLADVDGDGDVDLADFSRLALAIRS